MQIVGPPIFPPEILCEIASHVWPENRVSLMLTSVVLLEYIAPKIKRQLILKDFHEIRRLIPVRDSLLLSYLLVDFGS